VQQSFEDGEIECERKARARCVERSKQLVTSIKRRELIDYIIIAAADRHQTRFDHANRIDAQIERARTRIASWSSIRFDYANGDCSLAISSLISAFIVTAAGRTAPRLVNISADIRYQYEETAKAIPTI